MVIGNASVILVVTISLTSRDYILEQIRGIGSNIVYAYYETGGKSAAEVEADFVKVADVDAIREQLGPRIVAATGVMTNYDRMLIEGREEDVKVIGTDEHYPAVRNLVLLSGRFLDWSDVALREKVAMLTERLAQRLYGSQQAAAGQILKVHGLQFTVIGTFREKVESFGLSELSRETVVIHNVIQSSQPGGIDPVYGMGSQKSGAERSSARSERSRQRGADTVKNMNANLEAPKEPLYSTGLDHDRNAPDIRI